MTIPQRLYTVEEFEQFIALPENSERLFELINGEIVEKMPTEKHGELAGWIVTLINNFVRPRKLGRAIVEGSHQHAGDEKNSFLPDVSFISGKRAAVEQGSVPRMPDLAVEIKSPGNSLKRLEDKAHYYLLYGTKMVLILDYKKRYVIVMTPDTKDILVEGDNIDFEDVIPGFILSVQDIFEDPLEE
jgi:Uma2 family endonuclease